MPWQMWVANRYPDVIVRPDSPEGIAEVVRSARAQNKKLAIKSGGHNVSEAFLRNGGILLDLGELQGVEVNAAEGTAWVEPALWSHGLLRATLPHGLAFPVAHCATVPMGGYLLGGGLGYNHDNWGTLACDSILAAEVTLASGQTVIANERDYPDLYWALRGSGTGFPGVVRRYKLRLFPAPDTVMESSFIYPLSRLQEATDLLQAWAAAKPRDTELMMLLAHSPVADNEAPPLEQKVCIVRAVAYCATREAATATLGGLSDHPLTAGAVLKNELWSTSLQNMQEESVDTRMGLGFGRYAVDTIWTERLPEVMDAIRDHFAAANSPKTHFVISPKMTRSLHGKAAASVIGDTFVGAYTMWDRPEDDSSSFEWLDGASALMRPLAVGQYINEVDAFRDPAVLQRCFSKTAWKNLSRLRRKYDPEGVFAGWPGLDQVSA
jgi:FAD/FMN-containing dehydrogenase